MDTRKLERLIRQMCYGDALVMPRRMRLEYLQPAFNPETGLGGFDYYKLITPSRSYVVHIRSWRVLSERQHETAECLAALGICAEDVRFMESGAKTSPDAPRWRLPHLLKGIHNIAQTA